MIESKKFIFYEDPGLTNVGISVAKDLRNRLQSGILNKTGDKRPLLFASPMVRAVETALWNFPGWQVRPIPYIAEKGLSYDNFPLPWEKQKKEKLPRAPNHKDLLNTIKFDVNPSDHPHRDSSSYK